MEPSIQVEWFKHGIYEKDAPLNFCKLPKEKRDQRKKWLVTFPYPYMNGRLHLGHGFSLTKAEFSAGFKRLRGYNVLFPFGFHCTGMPIQAAANKLKNEITKFGNPPQFPEDTPKAPTKEVDTLAKEMAALGKKGKAKKAKTGQKAAGTSYQWQALEKMGIPQNG